MLSKGVTSFQDAGSSFATIDLMKAMIDEGRIGVRLWVMVSDRNAVLAQKLKHYRMIDYAQGHLFHAAMPEREISRLIAEGELRYSGISPEGK